MSEKYSPRLKAIMAEIKEIFDKHDVAGVVTLSDGLGMNEFRYFVDTPSWSMLRFLNDGSGVHLKAHAKSKPIETNKTVNVIYSTHEILANSFMVFEQIRKQVDSTLEVDHQRGEFYYGPGHTDK